MLDKNTIFIQRSLGRGDSAPKINNQYFDDIKIEKLKLKSSFIKLI